MLGPARCADCDELCRRRILYESIIGTYANQTDRGHCVRMCLSACLKERV